MNEKGSVLPSVLVFMLLMSILVTGTAKIYRSNMYQLRMTQDYYEVQTMLLLTKLKLEETLRGGTTIQEAIVDFGNGNSTIHRIGDGTYQITGTLKNRFSKEVLYTYEDREE